MVDYIIHNTKEGNNRRNEEEKDKIYKNKEQNKRCKYDLTGNYSKCKLIKIIQLKLKIEK